MVIPFNSGGPLQPLPPPAELEKFRPALGLVAFGYLSTIVCLIIGGNFLANCLMYGFIGTMAVLMAVKSQEYLGQCVLPLMIIAFIILLTDMADLVLVFTLFYHNQWAEFFEINCTKTLNISVVKPQHAWLKNGTNLQEIILPINTTYRQVDNNCDWRMFTNNMGLALGIVTDVAAIIVGCRMWKTARGIMGELGLFGPASSVLGQPLEPRDAESEGRGFQPFQGTAQQL